MPKLTALDNNVALPLLYAGVSLKERRERGCGSAEGRGIGRADGLFPNQPSGGRRCVSPIARAMVGKPDLFAGRRADRRVDTKAGQTRSWIFSGGSDEGMTILMIDHPRAYIAQCADKISTTF